MLCCLLLVLSCVVCVRVGGSNMDFFYVLMLLSLPLWMLVVGYYNNMVFERNNYVGGKK